MISFQPPIHSPSEKKQALLISSDYSKVIDLDQEGIDGCPDKIIDSDREYQYEGVEYGRAVYRQIVPIPIVETYDDLDKQIVKSINGITDIIEKANKDADSEYEDQTITFPPASSDFGTITHAIAGPLSLISIEFVLANLQSMLENPPGYEGIKVNGEHYGNKYIDYGWQEAVRRVIAMIEGEEISPK